MVQSTATAGKVVAAAKRDVGKPGPVNTCVSNGMQRFASEAGAPKLTWNGRPTASITEARLAGKAKHDGWTYHDGLAGIAPGDFADWARPAGIFHVSAVIQLRRSALGVLQALQTIGSGGPSGKINWQPTTGNTSSQGWNVAGYFRGYWRAPYAAPVKTTTKPAGQTTVKVKAGEGGIAFAARVKVPLATLKKLNPSVRDWGDLRLGQSIRTK